MFSYGGNAGNMLPYVFCSLKGLDYFVSFLIGIKFKG